MNSTEEASLGLVPAGDHSMDGQDPDFFNARNRGEDD
jgi:hypothetical protein